MSVRRLGFGLWFLVSTYAIAQTDAKPDESASPPALQKTSNEVRPWRIGSPNSDFRLDFTISQLEQSAGTILFSFPTFFEHGGRFGLMLEQVDHYEIVDNKRELINGYAAGLSYSNVLPVLPLVFFRNVLTLGYKDYKTHSNAFKGAERSANTEFGFIDFQFGVDFEISDRFHSGIGVGYRVNFGSPSRIKRIGDQIVAESMAYPYVNVIGWSF